MKIRYRLTLILIMAFRPTIVYCQPAAFNVWYELTSVPETASGFKFNENRTFEFYYIYGAVDRYASGNWHESGDTLILDNAPKPPLDFRLIVSDKKKGSSTTVKIKCLNPALVNNVHCRLVCADTLYGETDANGIAVIECRHAEKIELLHGYFPPRSSLFAVNADHNYFEFEVERWIADVEFREFKLIPEGKMLKGAHPLINKENCTYLISE